MRCISANATLSNIAVTEFNTQHDDFLSVPSQAPASPPIIDKHTQSQQVKENMKENKEPTVSTKAPIKDEKTRSKESLTPSNKVPVSKLSIVAIGLTLCLGGFFYFHNHQQLMRQDATIAALKTEITTLKDTLQQSITDELKAHVSQAVEKQNTQLLSLEQQVKNQLSEQTQKQQQFIAKIDNSIKVSEQNIINFNERLSAMSTTDNKVWLISQANYLVNLAGRKIWNDQDYTTARLLLKNADTSLAQANDPSLLPARQAINKDISSLSAISFTDFDGIVMSLMELVDSINTLPLVEHYQDIALNKEQNGYTVTNVDDAEYTANGALAQTNSSTISTSIADWYSNLVKGTESFFQKFIQVEKYDTFSECIADAGEDADLLKKCQAHTAVILPEQALYLKENIKLKLLIAAQAVPRHQEQIYQQSLNDVSVWVNAYFADNSPFVKAFLNELQNLQKQSISNQNVPAQLSSNEELSKLMQTRVRAMLAE
ncbi:uroporphyrinogen-III C-methyltransferase [Orbus hercynius]|nr:uroporphyrinogen-III C-methyltransferase [Orbus hercynius]